MVTDTELLRDIAAELKWDPSLRDDDIATGVRDGIVTLAGFVDSYADRWKAEKIASRVRGVRAIANDLEVRLPSTQTRSDPDVARAALDSLRWNTAVPEDRVKVRVDNGWITLDGIVDWQFQKESAERAVRYLRGVTGVSNLIAVQRRAAPADVRQQIRSALERSARLDANRVDVEIEGGRVTLLGTLHSLAEMREAVRAASRAPGVVEVVNHITIDPGAPAAV